MGSIKWSNSGQKQVYGIIIGTQNIATAINRQWQKRVIYIFRIVDLFFESVLENRLTIKTIYQQQTLDEIRCKNTHVKLSPLIWYWLNRI
jgi:hypothetical protein